MELMFGKLDEERREADDAEELGAHPQQQHHEDRLPQQAKHRQGQVWHHSSDHVTH